MALSSLYPQIKHYVVRDIAYSIREVIRVLDRGGRLNELFDLKEFKKIQDEIYELYNKDAAMVLFLNDILQQEGQERYYEVLRKEITKFKQALILSETIVRSKNNLQIVRHGIWIQVNPEYAVDAKRRLYINCQPEYINHVVNYLATYLAQGHAKYIFKFPDANSIRLNAPAELVRADKLVIYYENDAQTHEFLIKILQTLRHYLRIDVPLFTHKIENGIAFAYEPPPEVHEYVQEHTGERASFGMFMALVIARYLQAWVVAHRRCPDCKERLPVGAMVCPRCGAPVAQRRADMHDIPNEQEIKTIAEEIFTFKLKQRHNFQFEPR